LNNAYSPLNGQQAKLQSAKNEDTGRIAADQQFSFMPGKSRKVVQERRVRLDDVVLDLSPQ
jgi:hypothetical protein